MPTFSQNYNNYNNYNNDNNDNIDNGYNTYNTYNAAIKRSAPANNILCRSAFTLRTPFAY